MNGLLGSENDLIEDYNQNRHLPSLWTGIDGISLKHRSLECDSRWIGISSRPQCYLENVAPKNQMN